MSLQWEFDGTFYEVSSKDHLLQIMNQGSLFTDIGSPPTDYWGSSFIQKTDIDLETSPSIIPIGTESNSFTGIYNGDNYSISNWAFSSTSVNVGLFGYISNATLRNIVLRGIWDLTSDVVGSGFLIGKAEDSLIIHITTDFEDGTILTSTQSGNGFVAGWVQTCTLEDITMGGIVEMSATGTIGGVVGEILSTSLYFVRNISTTTNFSGSYTGGIWGFGVTVTGSYIMNAMKGDITGSSRVGGIGGRSSPSAIDYVVNAITGSVTSSASTVGGLFGEFSGSSTYLVNYMSGDVANGITSPSGGGTVSNSVLGMNGNCSVDASGASTSTLRTYTEFGLTASAGLDPSASITGYTFHPNFTDLPYFPFYGTSTEGDGTIYDWEFVFPNVSGNLSYADYNYFTITSSRTLSFLYNIEFDEQPSSDTIHWFKTGEVYTDSSLSLGSDPSPVIVFDYLGILLSISINLDVTMYSQAAMLTWESSDGISSYDILYKKDGETEATIYRTSVSELSINVIGLDSGSTYIFYIYGTGSRDKPLAEITGISPAIGEVSTNELFEFLGYDLSEIESDNIDMLLGSMTTSSQIIGIVDNRGAISGKKLTFVSDSDTLDISSIDTVLFPFVESGSSTQNVTLQKTDTSVENVSFDETTSTLTIDGSIRSIGDSFVFDGRKATLANLN